MALVFRNFLMVCLLTAELSAASASGADKIPSYETGYKAIMKLGGDLYRALDPKYQKIIHVQPVSLETDVTPFVKPLEYPDDNGPMRMVFVSVGFVDLMNNVAHSKAIDKIEKGYFKNYVVSLAGEDGYMSLKEIPKLQDKKYWSDDMLNEQISNFNQMVGMVIAIDLSHHYLGHFKKYEKRLADEKGAAVPINNLLTDAEWDASVRNGAYNALESGLGVDGLKALYEAIDKMPVRPAWTAYFLPERVKVAKLLKDLEKYEKAYFQGQKFNK